MLKPLMILLFGCALGVLATMWWLSERSDAAKSASIETVTNSPLVTGNDRVVSASVRDVQTTAPTLADINARRSDFEQTLGLYELMRDMGPADLLALLDEASLISGADYVAATSIIIGRLAELDPQRALDRALETATLAQPAWIHAIFSSWARLDAGAAREALDNLPLGLSAIAQGGIYRSNGANQGLSTSIQVIGQGVLASGGSLGVDTSAAVRLSPDADLPTAWQEAMNINNPQQRMHMLAQIASLWSQTDPQAALQASSAMPANGMREGIQQHIIMAWAQSDPRAAVEWLGSQSSSSHTANMLQVAVRVLAQSDFEEARFLVSSLDNRVRDHAQLGLLDQWIQKDLEGVKSWLASQTNQEVRQKAVHQITMRLATEDPQAAQAWLADLPGSEAAMGTMIAVSMIANVDIDRASKFVDAIEQSTVRQSAAQALIQQWSRFSPEDAHRWIANQASEQRPDLYRSLTQSWGRHAAEQALNFAERLLDTGERDQALVGVLPYLSSDQQQRVADLVQDADLKNQASAMTRVIRR